MRRPSAARRAIAWPSRRRPHAGRGLRQREIDLWPLTAAPSAAGTMKPTVLKKHQALVWTLAFSPDGKTLASGSADNNVLIWDVPTGEDLMTFKHNGIVEALQFSPDGRVLASASHEPSRGSVCLWRAPADEDAPGNTLRASGGPTVFDRPAGLDSATAMRPAYPEPSAQPARGGRRPVDPAAPLPPGYSPRRTTVTVRPRRPDGRQHHSQWTHGWQ